MSSRRLLPPLYPGSPITANFPRAGNSHHNSPCHPFQHNPAAAAAHFASQAGPGCKAGSSSHQQPPSLLSPMTHASAGVGGISSTVSQDIASGSGFAAGSSSYWPPPSPLPGGNSGGGVLDGGSAAHDAWKRAFSVSSFCQMPPPPSPVPVAMDTDPTSGGGNATFFSSPDTGLASVVGLAPLTCTQPSFTWSADQAPSGSGGLPAPILAQSTATVDFGSTEGSVLPPLPPALRDPPPMQTATVVNLEAFQYVDLEAVPYVDLEGPPGGHLNSSGSTNTQAPQPYSSGYTCITQAPSTPLPLTSSSSMPAPVANLAVKKEAVDYWSWGTSQLGKNNFTSGGSSSAPWMPSSGSGSADLVVLESKPNQLPSPLVKDFADGQFTQNDIDKIMADKALGDLVLKDPKRVWR